MPETVIQHLLGRLKELGIKDIFGVPGDFAFPINDAICDDKELRWVGCCNELNASYAADGYARTKGMAVLSTTFGVGELSALCGIAGSFAEHNIIFHIVGIPKTSVQEKRTIVHHTLGHGEFDQFMSMAGPVVCAKTLLTPQNCISEVDRVITAALKNRRPVYIAIPHNYVHEEIPTCRFPENEPVATISRSKAASKIPKAVSETDSEVLEEVVSIIVEKLSKAKKACIIPGFLVDRFGLKDLTTEIVNTSGMPYVTLAMDKSVFDETNPSYLGLYMGKLINPEIREFVESCHCVLMIGAILSDNNLGMFTAELDKSRIIHIMPSNVNIGYAEYANVKMVDILQELVRKIPRRTDIKGPVARPPEKPERNTEDPIMADYLYASYAKLFRPEDIILVDSGTSYYGALPLPLPKGVKMYNQMLWGAIGWATPASFGTALAAPDKRVVLITGEGSHQMTVQEISQFYRYGLKPIIFVLNNQGYLIERMLSKKLDYCYNELPQWNYQKLPEVLGCDDWITRKATTCGELDKIMEELENLDRGAYIEIMTPKFSAPLLMEAIHKNL